VRSGSERAVQPGEAVIGGRVRVSELVLAGEKARGRGKEVRMEMDE